MANEAERKRWNDDDWTRAWVKREVLTDRVTPFLLDALALRPGQRILDVGCGGGKTTIAAARAVGPEGTAVGVDISVQNLALARNRAQEVGCTNIRFIEADVQVDPLDESGFDIVTSQFGVMFFDEPITAFSRLFEALRPGGGLTFACWQTIDRNPWFPGTVLARFVPPPPPPGEGKSPAGPFTFGDPTRVHEILAASGFTDIACESRDTVSEAPGNAVSDDHQLAFLGVAPTDMDEARAVMRNHLSQFGDPDGTCRFPLAFQVVSARRP
ncbi:MAG: class I SAM-dependent methyltransferase [Acidimicrobiales bacterium]